MSGRILLTADSTLMSDYHHNEFIGFGACAPSNFIPDFLYRRLFFPPVSAKKGNPVEAPYGLRKIEAQLLKEKFNVSTVAPTHLKRYVGRAKALGIHVMDPFGLGPASSTFAAILKKEPFLAQHFRQLLDQPSVRKAKKNGLKIIVGGPGTWQFHFRPEFAEAHGIDCVLEGEAENVVRKIFNAALNGEELPKYYEVSAKETPTLDEIPDIVNASVNGLVEIGRGCCRGCQFCSVTTRPLRWYPIEKILREIDVNMTQGGIKQCCLHGEDVMLYGSTNALPDDRKLLELTETVRKKCDLIVWSHCSLAAVASKPKLFAKVAETIKQKQPWWGVEIGIETGSSKLVKKMMPAKTLPFKSEEWPEVVHAGMGLMHDNGLIPASTLIVGAPEETEDDLAQTVQLVEDLRHIRSLIVPLFFVPMGKMKNQEWFKDAELTKLHKELLVKCMEHDFYWIDKLIEMGFPEVWRRVFLKQFYKIFVAVAKYKVAQSGIRMG